MIGELDTVPNHSRIVLGGLDKPAIARYVELSSGRSAPAELVDRIDEQTGGNPFFVGEVVRLLADQSASDGAVSGEIPPWGPGRRAPASGAVAGGIDRGARGCGP